MNEQIKQMMTEAGTDISGKWMSIDNAERFAELIVRECIRVSMDEIVSDEDIDNTKAIEDRCYLQGNNGGVVDAVVSIKQHFGIQG